MMKKVISKVNTIYLLCITVIQALCAVILGYCAHQGRWLSFFEMLSVFAFVFVLSLIVFRKGKNYVLIALYIFTLPAVFDTAVFGGHWVAAPDLPKGNVAQLNMQRFVWPHISEIGYSYGLDILDDGEYINLSKSADLLWNEYMPLIEAEYGTYSPAIYNQYVSLSFGSLKKEIFQECLGDFFSYYLAPITTEANLLLGTSGRNGENFIRVINACGNVGRFYYHFSFAAGVGLAVLSLINILISGFKAKNLIITQIIIVIIALYDIYCPIRGFDYRNAAWIYIIYGLLFCNVLKRNSDSGQPQTTVSKFNYNLGYMRKSDAYL